MFFKLKLKIALSSSDGRAGFWKFHQMTSKYLYIQTPKGFLRWWELMLGTIIYRVCFVFIEIFSRIQSKELFTKYSKQPKEEGVFWVMGDEGSQTCEKFALKIHSQLLRCSTARRSSTGFSQVGPTKFYWLNYWHTCAE